MEHVFLKDFSLGKGLRGEGREKDEAGNGGSMVE